MVMVRFMMSRRMMMKMTKTKMKMKMNVLIMMVMVMVMMLRWKTDPKAGRHALSEPAQSKRTWTFHRSNSRR